MQEESELFFISEEETGERLDKILAKRFSHAGSRSYFQFLIEEEKVLLNGAPVKKRIKPHAGDEIEVEYILLPELKLTAEEIPLEVLFEDSHILVINKPAGMVVHPAPGHWSGTFVNALLHHCRGSLHDQQDSSSLRPGIVHRLDKDTSGVLIAAKTSLAQQRLIEMFSGRQIYKEYLALCIGNPGEGMIEVPIGRNSTNRKLMGVVFNGGRSAQTAYKTLSHSHSGVSLVKVVIATGRTHQIRVHMKHRGTPILGDSSYGSLPMNAKYGVARQMLHASRLRLQHPIENSSLEFVAPIPFDMQQLMTKLQLRI